MHIDDKKRAAPAAIDDGSYDGLLAERIVETTREIAFEGGFNAVSMRQIAGRLNVTATAIYYHFKSKADLLDRVAEDIVRNIAVPRADQASWQSRLREFVLSMRQTMADYPGLNRHMVNNRNSGAALRWIETMLDILAQAGFTTETIRPAFAMLVFFIDPMTLVDDKRHVEDEAIHDAGSLSSRAEADPGNLPNVARFMIGDVTRTYKSDFALALDRIIVTIERELDQPGS
ncbi:MAG: TetR family transcriptional regulator [Sphingomonas sp.]|nr:TetR family transcriptional regulator [Sphingomonas sp.]